MFTINWYSSGAKLEAGSTYSSRSFYLASNLGDVKPTSDTLRGQTNAFKIGSQEYNPRSVDLYTIGNNFMVVAAELSEGTSTSCGTATRACEGKSTPSIDHVPFFYITCGSEKYLGPDPYHFTPNFSSFPDHGTYDNPVRSYRCEGQDLNVRPAWKLMGFFPTGCVALAPANFNSDLCYNVPSAMPSTSLEPTVVPPSISPSTSSRPSIDGYDLTTPFQFDGNSLVFEGVDGFMFEISAREQNVLVKNLGIAIFDYGDGSTRYEQVELLVYASPGGIYDASAGDAIDQDGWHFLASELVSTSATVNPEYLPHGTFSPIMVPQGTTMGFYVTLNDRRKTKKILVTGRTNSLLPLDITHQDSDILVREGVAKDWIPCLNWGGTLVDLSFTPIPYGFHGSILYTQAGVSPASALPTGMPSSQPSTSGAPSKSIQPSINDDPSRSPSIQPSATLNPSFNPTTSNAPTLDLIELVTPTNITQGNSGDGVMFDIFAAKPCEVFSVAFGEMRSYPMNIQVYTKRGSHYAAYDDASQWDLIKVYTNYTFSYDENTARRISFPAQDIGIEQTRAFYIAIVETYGLERPLGNGLLTGYNYLNGVWKTDGVLSIMEGLKFSGISTIRPFGDSTYTSGPVLHGGPGGISFNMKNAIIRYREGESLL